jgi:uncharacterized protein YifN (PemK superfamily)
MALPYFPHRGEILVCDFDTGFKPPEMVKKRPVVVVSRRDSHSRRLCSVVPFSTTEPNPVMPWHHPLPHITVPGWKATGPMWAKCDMLATVSFERLNKPYVKTRHGRNFQELVLEVTDMAAISACLRAYLGL